MTNPTIYVLFLLALCSSCGQTADRSSDETPDTTAVKPSRVDSMMMEISRTPDSLRTPEQLETIRKVLLMVARYVEIDDGVYAFTLPKKEFVEKTGLDIESYDAIMKNMDDNNSYTEEMAERIDFKELEESFNKQKEQWLKEYGD